MLTTHSGRVAQEDERPEHMNQRLLHAALPVQMPTPPPRAMHKDPDATWVPA